MRFETGFTMNSVFWLTSPRSGEEGWIDCIIDDVSVACIAAGTRFKSYTVPNSAALLDALDRIEAAAHQGWRPLLYLDMHGSIAEGVEIAGSGESVSWPVIVQKLRLINIATGNN